MKRIVYASTASKIAAAEKKIRQLIYSAWTCDENGNPIDYFSNPNMLGNIVMKQYADEDPDISFTQYVFDRRNDLFNDYVIDYVETNANWSDEIQNAAMNYYYDLSPSDYNRNLYLRRDEARFRREGLKSFGY